MRKADFRSGQGAAIPEFAMILFVTLMLVSLPLINVCAFAITYVKLEHHCSRQAKLISLAETREDALKLVRSSLIVPAGIAVVSQLESPEKSGSIDMVVTNGKSVVAAVPIDDVLPDALKPSVEGNQAKYTYYYQTRFSWRVVPPLNLSALPVVGQTPILGKPALMTLTKIIPVEYLSSLEN